MLRLLNLLSMIYMEKCEMSTISARMTTSLANAVVLICLLLSSRAVFAQVEANRPGLDDLPQSFYMDAMSFASSDSLTSRVDVYSQVGYDNLSFVKSEDHYSASYDMTISFQDSTGMLVTEKTWTEQIKDTPFDESVSPGLFSLTERSFTLRPGRYTITALMHDNETKVTRKIVRQLFVSDFSHSTFSLSDIMLVSKVTSKEGKRTITPSVSSNVGNLPDAFFVFFQAYNGRGIDSAKIILNVVNEKHDPVLDLDTTVALGRTTSEILLRVDNSSLSMGNYTLVIRAFALPMGSAEESTPLASTNRQFFVRWHGMPRGLKDLDVAIDQLRYIAKDSELANLKEAKTIEEKQKRFLEFWKKRNTNPNSPRNPRMEEYYRRVEYANKHFKHFLDGWRTDMGMVYIVLGAPSNVDRHPFEIDSKPYEVWSYYDLNYQFVFLDDTGFGDYRLISPIWEVWQRPRD